MKIFRPTLFIVTVLMLSAFAIWWSAPRTPSNPSREKISKTESHPHDHATTGDTTPRSPAAVTQALPLPSAAGTSSDPVAQAVADGVVLETRIDPGSARNALTRLLLVQTKVQPRPVRVVEQWKQEPPSGAWVCQRRDMYLADQLIVKASAGTSADQFKQQIAALGMTCQIPVSDGVFTVRLPNNNLAAAPDAMRLLAAHPEIAESAEIDGVGFGGGLPNDPLFDQQWGLHNTGQSGGTVNVDVDAPDFWDHLDSTPGMVIAVIDSGLNFTHPDLQNVAWVNPKETAGDGVDNDHNGFVDDINGWDFVNNDNDPTDDNGHGSNISGIIAASRNNGEGAAGLLGGVHILVCKVLNAANSGATSDLVSGVAYARQQGVPVMNLSLQNYPYSSTLDAEFTACQNAGILLCICAGNQGVDNDASPNYPSCYPQPNIIAVGNHDRTDAPYAGSNYGLASVDLFAPGRDILAPGLGATYALHTGTSESTPFVTAVATALKYLNPSWKAPEIKSRILASLVFRASYSGLCVSGGRLNAFAALGVSSAPAIITQPVSQTVTAGTSVTLSVAASGDPAPTYQWKKDGVDIGGATSSTYMIANATTGDTGSYTLVATNAVGSATSNPATLTISAALVAPSITTQPASQTVNAGTSVTFTVTASGNPAPAYQWKINGSVITDATNSSYTIANPGPADSASYTVSATNSVGSTTSDSAVLTVIIAPSNAVITITVE